MRLAGLAIVTGAPGVGDFRPDENQVAVIIGRNVIADEALAAAVQSEGEFAFDVVVPLERDGFELAIEQDPGRVARSGDVFEIWLQRRPPQLMKSDLRHRRK